jgi:hypothetical protein
MRCAVWKESQGRIGTIMGAKLAKLLTSALVQWSVPVLELVNISALDPSQLDI